MPNFIGQPCTSCRSVIAEGEDIVVCPNCGSPYHRECYKKEGKCINTALHESGESWKPELSATGTNVGESAAAAIVACKNCGTENSSENAFCKECGAPINMEKAAGAIYQRIKQDDAAGGTATFGGGFAPFPNVTRLNQDSDVDGITVGEYNSYVGRSWMYFLPKFLRFSKQNTKLSFNFCAFFFPHLYFFYRKMLPMGIAMLVLTTILSLPSTIMSLIQWKYLQSIAFTNSQWFANIYDISYFLSYAVDIVAGLFANWLYYKKAKSDIERIKSTAADDVQLKISIADAGGTSWKYVLTAVITMSAVSMLLIYLIYRFMGA